MLIGISGAAGAGKDTFAKMLAEELRAAGHWVVVDAFAANLKVSAAAAIGTTPKVLEDFKREGTMSVSFSIPGRRSGSVTMTVREYLQRYGTEAHRDVFGDEFWVKDLLTRYLATGPEAHVRIVTDCRFENESAVIGEKGGTVFFVTRPDDDGIGTSHPSEQFGWATEHDHVTHVGNLGTLDDLQAKAAQHAQALLSAV